MENQSKNQIGKSLSRAIHQIVKESLKASLYQNAQEERKKQKSMLGEEDDESESNDKQQVSSEPNKSSKTVDDEKEKLKKGEIKTKDIVDKLNTIRSGKSFKDSAVSSKLEEYIESLSKPEKVALLAFLKGLSQIVTGEVDPNQAQDPSDSPSNVKMQKGDERKERSIKPNVIKAPAKEKTEKKPSSEDTSGPVPITPTKK